MSNEILTRIIRWAESKDGLHKDAVRRIYQQGQLVDSDVDQLCLICYAAHSIPLPEDSKIPEPLGLITTDVGSTEVTHQPIVLRKISEVRNVNNLAEGQTLCFSETGISILYGDNGAGKSGYSRILRRVCRARCKNKNILTNVFKNLPPEPPTAKIDYRIGDKDYVVRWVQGQDFPAEMSNICLFDADCASVHVTEENSLAFTPQGLDILPKLAELFRNLQLRIRAKIGELEKSRPSFLKDCEKYPNTQVYSRITSIRASTDFKELTKWTELGKEDRIRLKNLTDLLSQDPSKQAKVLELRKERLVQLRDSCLQSHALITNECVTQIKSLWDTFRAAKSVADSTHAQLFASEGLSGVGGPAWKILWEAARNYSTQDAYHGREFPVIDEAALCVLCQQPLSTDATKRLSSFEDYIKGEVQKKAAETEKSLQNALDQLNAVGTSPKNMSENIKELALEDEELGKKIKRTLTINRWRKRRILRNVAAVSWQEVADAPVSLDTELQTVIDAVDLKCKDAIKASNSEEKMILEKELLELRAKDWLKDVLVDVEEYIKRLTDVEKLKSCLRDVDTTAITKFSTELTDEFITEAMREAFSTELKGLGLTYLGVELVKIGGQYGASRYQVQLADRKQDVPLTNVVSEGEHRAIALAAFLAEQATAPAKSGLIFDDPVSSLDHAWRQRIAERLVAEAKLRQVVLMTHDIVFVHALLGCANMAGIPLKVSHLMRNVHGAGISLNGVPWVAMTVKERTGYLKEQLQRAESIFRKKGEADYEVYGSQIYSLLRETWERAVEEVLLGQVVVRFGRTVQTQRLRYLTDITNEDVKIIDDNMTKCSRFMQGHDQAAAVNEKVPQPAELAKDISTFEEWVKNMRPRRN